MVCLWANHFYKYGVCLYVYVGFITDFLQEMLEAFPLYSLWKSFLVNKKVAQYHISST